MTTIENLSNGWQIRLQWLLKAQLRRKIVNFEGKLTRRSGRE